MNATSSRPTSPGPNMAAEYYGYGYDEEPAMVATTSSTFAMEGMEAMKDCPPMPADRVARKNRPFSRRGGAGHGSLLKAAVLASMESNDESDVSCDYRTPPSRNSSGFSVLSLQSLADDASVSPRKRTRFLDDSDDDEKEEDEDAIVRASNLIEGMSVRWQADASRRVEQTVPVRPPLIRRVSRRTSYESEGYDHRCEDDDEE